MQNTLILVIGHLILILLKKIDRKGNSKMKNCEECIHFYECDNTGFYKMCLPSMKFFTDNNTINITVYRDTFEDFWNNPNMGDNNIADIIVSVDFAKQYWKENQAEYYKTFEDFYCNYTCDDTEDFYQYASERKAILDIERW